MRLGASWVGSMKRQASIPPPLPAPPCLEILRELIRKPPSSKVYETKLYTVKVDLERFRV